MRGRRNQTGLPSFQTPTTGKAGHAMSQWDPKSLWDELVQAFRDWGEDEEQAKDPSLAFHLLFTAPLLLALLALMKR